MDKQISFSYTNINNKNKTILFTNFVVCFPDEIPIVVDYDISIRTDIFSTNKRVSAEPSDFWSIRDTLHKIIEGKGKKCYYEPMLDNSFKIIFEKTGIDQVDIVATLQDDLYEDKLEITFNLTMSQLENIANQIEYCFPKNSKI